MTELLTNNLPLLAGAPNGIKKLRELILELAVRGKLVPQDPNDEPASELLKRISEEKARLVAEGKIKKRKPLTEIYEEAQRLELPAGWEWSSLAQVSFVNPRNAAADSLEVSFVPMTFIGTRFDDQHAQEPRLWGEVKQGFTHFAEGDIGVAKITPCFENSKACVFSNLVNGLGAGTTELHIVRPVTGTLDPRYVLAYLKSPQFLLVGETKMTGTAGQKRLPKDFVEENPFPLPPLAEQHRIVAKVDELMALCDRLEAQQADAENAHAQLVQALLDSLTQASDATDFAVSWQRLAENFHTLFTNEFAIDALKKALLHLAVTGKLVPQDLTEEPASELLKRVEGEKQRLVAEGVMKKHKPLVEFRTGDIKLELPTAWKWVPLLDITTGMDSGWSPACLGNSSPSDDVWGVLKTTAVQVMSYLEHENKELPSHLEPRPEAEAKVGDILFTRAGPMNRVGISCLVESTRPKLMISDKIIRFHPVELGIYGRFIALCLNAGETAKYLEQAKSGMAASQVNISQEKLRMAPIPLAPLLEQHRIVEKVDQLINLCDTLKQRINVARSKQTELLNAVMAQV
ncbi:type I restriction enzyme, S subunit [Pseudomonas sp. UC 17F4]|uniref:restriction endonuclease subunit S n=1 Tax=Pseudomonas sp. UC 17F4 TaxID=1855328 RepID=UPI00088E9891|nr:restriction endonuclease subunit S [Pseudomonas sp. UC 17F4]SDQ58415.1 type I restriction enzyme, S subunit [Pseudomonas sp. UC 17F4]